MNIQGNFDYARLDIEGFDLDRYTAGGAVFWRNSDFALGGFTQYLDFEGDGGNLDYWTYGGIGEWYALPNLTVRANLGGATIEDSTGFFGGGGVSYYVIPNLSLNFDLTAGSIEDLDVLAIKTGAEYLISQDVPLALGANYVYTSYESGALETNAFMISLTWRIGDTGTLVDRDRSGTIKIPNVDNLQL